MSIDTQIRVGGADVLASGTIVNYIDMGVEFNLLVGHEQLEIEFIIKREGDGNIAGTTARLEPAKSSKGNRLALDVHIGHDSRHVASTAPVRIGQVSSRSLFLSFSVHALVQNTLLLSYTFSLGEEKRG